VIQRQEERSRDSGIELRVPGGRIDIGR
jgi:hypothetical protein